MKTTSILQMVIRVLGLIQLILGIVFWTGNALFLVICHILLGCILTLALLTLTYQAFRAGAATWLVVVATVCELALPIWGLAQRHILPASFLWLAQVLHLLCGVGIVGVAELLAVQMHKRIA